MGYGECRGARLRAWRDDENGGFPPFAESLSWMGISLRFNFHPFLQRVGRHATRLRCGAGETRSAEGQSPFAGSLGLSPGFNYPLS